VEGGGGGGQSLGSQDVGGTHLIPMKADTSHTCVGGIQRYPHMLIYLNTLIENLQYDQVKFTQWNSYIAC
jgi:hypothetical protein